MIGPGETASCCGAEGERKNSQAKGSDHDGTLNKVRFVRTPTVQPDASDAAGNLSGSGTEAQVFRKEALCFFAV